MTNDQLKSQAGFTLVEVLVAIFLMGLVITGALSLFSLNTFNADAVRNNYIASGLIQEGMEVVRNLRDNDSHAGRAFGSFSRAGVTADGRYRVQWNSNQLLDFNDTFLKKDAANGIYSYDSGGDTLFKREVQVTTVSAIEKKITVTVTWNQRNIARTLSAEDHLFNWK